MSQTIEAIYENGVFKPLRPVTLPEGTMAYVRPSLTADQLEELLRQEMLAEGIAPDQLEKILSNLRLAWAAFDSLTPEEERVWKKRAWIRSTSSSTGAVPEANPARHGHPQPFSQKRPASEPARFE